MEVHNGLQTVTTGTSDFRATGIQERVVNNIAVRAFNGDGAAREFSAWVASNTNPLPARLSDDATLATLALYAGTDITGTPLTLTPAFSATSGQDGASVSYDAGTVPNDTTQLSIVYTLSDSAATILHEEGFAVPQPVCLGAQHRCHTRVVGARHRHRRGRPRRRSSCSA